MRKTAYVIAAVLMSVMVTACGGKTEEATKAPEVTTEAAVETEETTETIVIETEKETSEETEAQSYEDNFAVDAEATADFAAKIKAAVAEKDLEALADLAAYPLYAGFADGGKSIDSREAFVELGAEKIFTPELMESIEAADSSSLSPSMAGFSLAKDGKPNIIFGVRDGKLSINGINY